MKKIFLILIALTSIGFCQVDSLRSIVQAPSDSDVDSLHGYIGTANPPTTLQWRVDSSPNEIDTIYYQPASADTYYVGWKAVDDTGNVSGFSSILSVVISETAGSSNEVEVDSLLVYFPSLPDSMKDKYNTFFSNLKDSLTAIYGHSVTNINQKALSFHILMTTDTTLAYHDLTNNGWTITSENSPTFTALEGVAGDGSSAGYRTALVPSSDGVQQDSMAVTMYCRTASFESKLTLGADGANDIAMSIRRGDATFRGIINGGTLSSFGAVSTSAGMFTVSRHHADTLNGYYNFAEATPVAVSSTGLYASTIPRLSAEGSSYQIALDIWWDNGVPYEVHRALINCFETYWADPWGKGVIP